IPPGIREGVEKYISIGETILVTLLDWRAMHKAPKFVDSNTFFNSWFILTSRRIIIAKNSSEFKRFRDIPLKDITQIFYELDNRAPRVSITSPGHEDIIDFPRQASHLCAGLEGRISAAIANSRDMRDDLPGADYIQCTGCGSSVPGRSHYCPECGAKLQNP
ncbi:MAG: PH domain-containing protein, partial [Candidatus Deferrimicrobiaceae bacterium]